jgi:DNA polymerase III delta prime subunit
MLQNNELRERLLIIIFFVSAVLSNIFLICVHNIVEYKVFDKNLLLKVSGSAILIIFLILITFYINISYGIIDDESFHSSSSEELLKHSRQRLLRLILENADSRLEKLLPPKSLMDLDICVDFKKSNQLNFDNFLHTIDCSWIFNQANEEFTSEQIQQKIFRIFQEDAKGRLLILGNPGAGKTTILLNLVKKLIKEALENEQKPIPVIFELTSWEPNQTIADWLVAGLKSRYNIRENLAIHWLENNQILPLLDGLDKQHELQLQCIYRINSYLNKNEQRQLVICCRKNEYESSQTPLRINTKAYINLPKQQIKEYLINANLEYLWKKIQHNNTILESVISPFILKILVEIKNKNEIDNLFNFISNNENNYFLLDDLLKIYIKDKLEYKQSKIYKKSKEPNNEQTIDWLIWLSQALRQHKQKEFLIERIQPSWLNNSNQKLIFRIIFGLVSSIILALICAFIAVKIEMLLKGKHGFSEGLFSEGFSILITTFISILVLGEFNEVLLFEYIKFYWFQMGGFWKNRLLVAIVIILSGIVTEFMYKHFVFIPKLQNIKPVHFLIVTIINSLVLNVIFSVNFNEIKTREVPNQGIKDSAEAAIFITVILFPFFILIYILINQKIPDTYEPRIFGLFCSLFFGLICGGIAVIQHVSMRYTLWITGDSPWNYTKFLNYASELGFIYQIGGRYRFIHELLEEHFAKK